MRPLHTDQPMQAGVVAAERRDGSKAAAAVDSALGQ